MSVVEVIYRFEYVSGVVTAEPGFTVFVQAANRGHVEEHVRARILYGATAPDPGGAYPSELAFDSRDAALRPGHMWLDAAELSGKLSVAVWIQVFATSLNVVPSATFRDFLAGEREVLLRGTEGEPQEIEVEDFNVAFASFAPGDFAVFSLPSRVAPPIPPIGPIEEAV